MDVQELLYVLPVFFVPIVIDLAAGELRGKPRYRMNDLLTNLTLTLLMVLGSVALAGGTLWLYTSVYQAHTPLSLMANAVGTWVLAFLAYDFLYYWAHRAHHRMSWLWGVHVVHHSGEDMNFGLAVRNSAFGEATLWFFFLPMALMGIPPSVYLGVTLIQVVFQYALHNTYVPELGWLERVLVTPSQHRVHHGRNRPYIDKNYGNVLVIWDRLFGTYQPELPEHPAVYGLRRSIRTLNPLTIHLHVFIDLFRKAAACHRARDKLLCWLMPPAWVPPSLDRSRCPERRDDGPSVSFRKHDPSMRRGGAAYCLAQFVTLASSIVLLLLNLQALSAAAVAVSCGLIVLTAWTLGGLLDGIPRYWRREPGRLAGVAVLGTALIWYDGLPAGQSLFPLALYVLASAVYLLRYQTDVGVVKGTRTLPRENAHPLIPSTPQARTLSIAVTRPRTIAVPLTASRPIELRWVSTIEDIAPADWDACFPHGDVMQSYALHHATEAASLRDVEFHYLVARRAEGVVAIVPCFRFRISLVVVAPPTVQRAVAGIRRLLPGFLYLRGLVVGTPIAICKDLLGLPPSLQGRTRQDVLRALLGEVVARAAAHHVRGDYPIFWLAFWRDVLAGWWVLPPVACFVALVIWHDRVVRARDASTRAVLFYERGIARIEDRWAGGGESGVRYLDEEHLYASDLDLFGCGSLFELLSSARTRAGEDMLAGWLKAPSPIQTLRLRQRSIEELRGRLDFREQLAVAGTAVRAIDTAALTAWATAPPVLNGMWPRIVASLLAAGAIGTGIWWGAGESPAPFLTIISAEIVLARAFLKRVSKVVHGIDRPAGGLEVLAQALIRLEREPVSAARLRELRAALTINGVSASQAIMRLQRFAERHDWKRKCHVRPHCGRDVVVDAARLRDRGVALQVRIACARMVAHARGVRSTELAGGVCVRTPLGSVSHVRRGAAGHVRRCCTGASARAGGADGAERRAARQRPAPPGGQRIEHVGQEYSLAHRWNQRRARTRGGAGTRAKARSDTRSRGCDIARPGFAPRGTFALFRRDLAGTRHRRCGGRFIAGLVSIRRIVPGNQFPRPGDRRRCGAENARATGRDRPRHDARSGPHGHRRRDRRTRGQRAFRRSDRSRRAGVRLPDASWTGDSRQRGGIDAGGRTAGGNVLSN